MRTWFLLPSALVVAALVIWYSGPAKSAEQQANTTQSAPATNASALIAAAQPARQSFANGAPSVDVLMEQFIRALTNKDTAALDQLRVSKAEYIDLIIPGTVPVGQPPRRVSDQPREYYWGMLDTKSRYYGEKLMGLFGGRTYHAHELKFSRPAKEYAWYKAYGQVKMELYGDDGVTYHLLSGWIAEVDGKYKFIGFNYES